MTSPAMFLQYWSISQVKKLIVMYHWVMFWKLCFKWWDSLESESWKSNDPKYGQWILLNVLPPLCKRWPWSMWPELRHWWYDDVKLPAMGRIKCCMDRQHLDNHHAELYCRRLYLVQTGLTITMETGAALIGKQAKKLWEEHWKTKGSIISAEESLFIRGKKWKCGL